MSFKNTLNYLLQKLTGYKIIRGNVDIHLQLLFDEKYGHRISRETNSSVDENNNPIPWITYPAYEFINQLNLQGKEIFEWGSGNSTLYFANRCKKITSIETSEEWHKKMILNKIDNTQIILSAKDTAAQQINKLEKKFDLILIDSSTNRYDCAKEAIKHLNSGGLIVLDNSARFEKAASFLKDQGYLQVDMHGIGPIVKFSTTTSLFFDRSFAWDSLQGKQPSYSKASLIDTAV